MLLFSPPLPLSLCFHSSFFFFLFFLDDDDDDDDDLSPNIGSLRESEILRDSEFVDAVVIPSPVPFPSALRQLSKEVETRAATRSFDLLHGSLSKQQQQQQHQQQQQQQHSSLQEDDTLSELPIPTPNLASSPDERDRNAHLGRALSDSAEWEALRQAPAPEPFDMEV
jgi:hypothetical protein